MAAHSKERRARAYLVLGALLEDEGEADCAATLYRRSISLRPGGAAAPRLRLGFLLWHRGDAAGMYEHFSAAVRLDPRAVRQSLAARRDEPEEARLISLVLYPETRAPKRSARTRPMADVIVEYLAGLTRAEAEIAAGRDAEAMEILEGMLRESPTDTSVVPLLTLAYLWLGAQNNVGGVDDRQGSVLQRARPELARLLFKNEGRDGHGHRQRNTYQRAPRQRSERQP